MQIVLNFRRERVRAADPDTFINLERFEEAKTLLRKTVPVARRVLGESHDLTLKMMMNYGGALLLDPGATPDDLREVVTTFEDAGQIARRVLGSAHPTTRALEGNLREARAALHARGATSSPSVKPSRR